VYPDHYKTNNQKQEVINMSKTESLSVKKAIEQRHSVRSFSPEPVTTEQIDELIQAARLAPSSLNSQPWRFKIVRDKNLLKKFGEKQISRTQKWIADAGAVLVCCADTANYIKDSQASAFFFRDNNLITGDSMDGIDECVERATSAPEVAKFGAAAMNVGISISFMMLRAVELGLGTCWVGMYDEQNVKELLGIDQKFRIVGLLVVGNPAQDQPEGHNRKKTEEIIIP
jgi:nitroreductase